MLVQNKIFNLMSHSKWKSALELIDVSNVIVRNCIFNLIGKKARAIEVNYASNILIENCTMQTGDWFCLADNFDGLTIRNCTVSEPFFHYWLYVNRGKNKNLNVENCTVLHKSIGESTIRIEELQGGLIKDSIFSNEEGPKAVWRNHGGKNLLVKDTVFYGVSGDGPLSEGDGGQLDEEPLRTEKLAVRTKAIYDNVTFVGMFRANAGCDFEVRNGSITLPSDIIRDDYRTPFAQWVRQYPETKHLRPADTPRPAIKAVFENTYIQNERSDDLGINIQHYPNVKFRDCFFNDVPIQESNPMNDLLNIKNRLEMITADLGKIINSELDPEPETMLLPLVMGVDERNSIDSNLVSPKSISSYETVKDWKTPKASPTIRDDTDYVIRFGGMPFLMPDFPSHVSAYAHPFYTRGVKHFVTNNECNVWNRQPKGSLNPKHDELIKGGLTEKAIWLAVGMPLKEYYGGKIRVYGPSILAHPYGRDRVNVIRRHIIQDTSIIPPDGVDLHYYVESVEEGLRLIQEDYEILQCPIIITELGIKAGTPDRIQKSLELVYKANQLDFVVSAYLYPGVENLNSEEAPNGKGGVFEKVDNRLVSGIAYNYWVNYGT